MNARFPKYVLLVLVPAVVVMAACGDRSVIAPTDPQAVFVTAEPARAQPEFSSDRGCPLVPAFGTRLRLRLRSRVSLTVKGIRFDFEDPYGRRSSPVVTLTSSATIVGNPSPMPIPTSSSLPTASPIPIPGFSPLRDISIGAGSSQDFAFFLAFACGIVADGTIFIGVDTVDKRGSGDTTRIDVPLGQ
jgi:hypothetical protein